MNDEKPDDVLEREAWEALSVQLLELDADAKLEVLERAEVDPATYNDSMIYWARLMNSEVLRGDLTRAKAYGEACAAELARRTESAAPAATAAAQVSKASLGATMSGLGVNTTGEIDLTKLRAALPFLAATPGAPAPTATPVHAPKPARPLDPMRQTIQMPVMTPGAVLPFGNPAAPKKETP